MQDNNGGHVQEPEPSPGQVVVYGSPFYASRSLGQPMAMQPWQSPFPMYPGSMYNPYPWGTAMLSAYSQPMMMMAPFGYMPMQPTTMQYMTMPMPGEITTTIVHHRQPLRMNQEGTQWGPSGGGYQQSNFLNISFALYYYNIIWYIMYPD